MDLDEAFSPPPLRRTESMVLPALDLEAMKQATDEHFQKMLMQNMQNLMTEETRPYVTAMQQMPANGIFNMVMEIVKIMPASQVENYLKTVVHMPPADMEVVMTSVRQIYAQVNASQTQTPSQR